MEKPRRKRREVFGFAISFFAGFSFALWLVGFDIIYSKDLGYPKSTVTSTDESKNALEADDDLPLLKAKTHQPKISDSILKEPITHHPAQLRCSQWEAYDTRIQSAKDFSSNCRLLNAISKDFAIKLCESRLFCGQGYFLVSRLNKEETCLPHFAAEISHNTHANAFFKTKLGPDAFQLTFNGPERASPSLWQHLGNCSYKLSYRLVNPGIYSVQLIHTYDEFKAVNEVIQNVWAKPVYRELLVTEFVLDVCSSHCPSFTSKHLQSLDLHICSRNERQQGVYLRMTNETEREVYKWQMYGHPYIWEPLGCRFDQKFELNSNSTCFTKTHKSILVIGDSQARILSWALDRRLSGSKDPLNEPAKSYGGLHNRYYNPQETAHRGLPNKIILNRNDTVVSKEELEEYDGLKFTEVTFKFQEYLNIFVDVSGYRTYDKKLNTSTTEKYLLDFDTVVFTVGHWPASAVHQGGHFSVERYVDLLEYISGYMESINRGRQSLGKQPLDFIWMDIYAFTIKLDPAVPHAKSIDWRINYRLKVWSDYANQIFQRRGMKQLNGFDATLPWAQSTLDGAHFHGTPAMDSQVDELLHKVNVCAR